RRPVPEPAALDRAVALIRAAKRPLVISGGGTIYSEASQELRELATNTGIPVADTQAGKGAISFENPASVGGVGSTGCDAANHLADKADLIIGIGTRYSDFTTASKTQFKNPDVKFVNVNVRSFDAAKESAEMVVADARETLLALIDRLADYHVDDAYTDEIHAERKAWFEVTQRCYHLDHQPLPAQTEVFGALNELMGPEDIVINAAGSMPGDLQALWQAKTPTQYHVEYAFSTMGYEIPAAMGVKLARPESEVVSIVGDGTYQMLPAELATVTQEHIKVIYVLLDNYGYSSIGSLSESHGSQRFGTKYRERGEGSHLDDTEHVVGVDIAANARSWGIEVLEVHTIEEFRAAYEQAHASDRATMIHIETDLYGPNPPGSSWWDVVVSETSRLESTQQARAQYEQDRRPQRHYL
ncbi:3D-(3,5/4)-trihydroxycyclohexane-1,2-dione acylhydrolase (decyclizing), partial [Propionibacterium freudenreichii]|nr:3D-(3,5/4)-trihydroxycyclohexane-1,2-dione acylhydrolase (decyclizing) [Propionibacterium freudenreichii]